MRRRYCDTSRVIVDHNNDGKASSELKMEVLESVGCLELKSCTCSVGSRAADLANLASLIGLMQIARKSSIQPAALVLSSHLRHRVLNTGVLLAHTAPGDFQNNPCGRLLSRFLARWCLSQEASVSRQHGSYAKKRQPYAELCDMPETKSKM